MNEKMQEIARKYMEVLMDYAGEHAAMDLLHGGVVAPMLFIHGVNGTISYSPDYLTDERSKEEFVHNARLLCIANGADAVAFLAEAWVKMPASLEAPNFTKRGPEYADRQEAIIILGQTRDTSQQLILPKQCCAKGEYIRPGQAHKIEAHHITGRFGCLFTYLYTDAQERKLAQNILDKRGVKTDQQMEEEEDRELRMSWRR